MFKPEYLPIAQRDMVESARYINHDLQNPNAANHLANALIEAGDDITAFPYANPVYIPIRPLKHEYRKRMVENYLMLYWVDEERRVITIARVIYAGRNYGRLLD